MEWPVRCVLDVWIVVKNVCGTAFKLLCTVSTVDSCGTTKLGRDEQHGYGGCFSDRGEVWDETCDQESAVGVLKM